MFYKKLDGNWITGIKISYPNGLIVTEINKNEAIDGWVWYDDAPEDYVIWYNSISSGGTPSHLYN